jgi:UrcA family protein
MNPTTLWARALPAAMTAIALACASAVANGQESPSSQQVNIESGKIVTITPEHSRTGIRPQAIQLSNNVSYADLDLTSPSGAAQLENRIRDTANSVCRQLMEDSPPGNAIDQMLDQRTCVDAAVDGAMARAKQVIASAEAKRQG